MSDDLDELMETLGAAQVSGRNAMDRYREFRQVFLGSDAGKRVFHDILAMAHVWKSSIQRDSHQTYAVEGERRLALKIIATVHIEPTAQAAAANKIRQE